MPACDVHAAIIGAEGLIKSAATANTTAMIEADQIIIQNDRSRQPREIMDESCANFWPALARPSRHP
jgi:hypothetical protein